MGRTKGSRGGSAGAVCLAVLVLAAIFAGPPLVRYLRAPTISAGFGIEDAVVALRLEARDTSYLVLVNEAGETRSVRLGERGFEHSRIAWSDAGLSTGGPDREYVLHEHGLTELPLPDADKHRSEQSRLASGSGFTVLMSSSRSPDAAFVDAASGTLSLVDTGYSVPELAGCGGEVLMAREDGVETVTPETRDFDGLGMFDGIEALACDAARVYGLGPASDDSPALQTLRIWDRETGASSEFEMRYPEPTTRSSPSSPFVWEGRLYWTSDWRLWSARLPATGAAAPGQGAALEVEPVAELGRFVGDYDPVVGIDEGVLARAGDRVYGVAADEEFVDPPRGASYDRLDRFAVFSIDATTGERRIEIEVGDIDFPKRDLHVHAVAVDPEWAAGR